MKNKQTTQKHINIFPDILQFYCISEYHTSHRYLAGTYTVTAKCKPSDVSYV